MLILKRLAVWFVETCAEVFLLGLVLTVLLGHDQHAFFKDLSIYSSGIVLMFFTTGYLLSTIVVRAVWRGQTLWSYPAIATVLFFIHFEIMNVGLGGAFEPSARLPILTAGACITFACTFVGGFVLREWAPSRTTSVGPAWMGHLASNLLLTERREKMTSFQLVLQFQASSLADFDSLTAFEDVLTNSLSTADEVDGHDFGSGEFNIFILSNNPTKAFEAAEKIRQKELPDRIPNAAYREIDGEDFVILWPPELKSFSVA